MYEIYNCFLDIEQSSTISQIDCGLPTVLKGAKILTESYTITESSQITLVCTEGLFFNYNITFVCTREGKWYPDPAKFSCLPEALGMLIIANRVFSCIVNNSIMICSPTQTPIQITLTRMVIIILCISH